MGQNYLGEHMSAMDRGYYHQLDSFGTIYHPAALHENEGGAKTKLGPREIGQSANPFQNQLQSLQARIRAGASSVEITFGGVGKGSNQQGTPEMYSTEEREAMRQLAEYNDVKTSTHSSFGMSGLAGFSQNGFDRQQQHAAMEEVRKAIDFASQATTGGAIVVHTGEWRRPMSEQKWAGEDGDFGLIKRKDEEGKVKELPSFMSYGDEPNKAQMLVVDTRTGRFISGISKDQIIFEPKWVRAKDYKDATGKDLPMVDIEGKPVAQFDPDDFVDADGRIISKYDTNNDHLFRRLPKWNEDKTRFDVEDLTWQKLKARTDEWNKDHPGQQLTPEALYANIQIQNQVLQARGQSLYHAQRYEEITKNRERLQHALSLIQERKKNTPSDEHWRFQTEDMNDARRLAPDLIPPDVKDTEAYLQESIRDMERQLRHIHESSASADVQAATLEAQSKNLATMEEYGIKESGRALAELGVYAMEKNKKMMQRVKEEHGDAKKYSDLYVAPENVFPAEYGSHPDELVRIVEQGRDQMKKNLQNIYGKSEKEAEELAKKHIKTTIDVGHLNMWKTHMTRNQGETDEAFNKRFDKWAMEKLDMMHKKGVLGHFHLTDNFGFNDEHLTPGQGNAPIRKFVEFLEKQGYNDFIVEQSGMNDATILGESWSYLGVLGFKTGSRGQFGQRFTDMHWRHAGGYAPPNYMVGAYVPSNEWTLWSGAPLE
jgi:hypothetical protein